MKKGFTIIEIIISIGLIAVIGTVSIVSFNFIKKSNKLKTLENMSDKILTAVNVYIETNDEIKNELYNNKNGLKIPLTTLENSGLVDFSNIDVSDEYVVTMLGSTDSDDDTCASTYTAKSWNFKNGETIYICEKSDGSSNLVTVAGVADNLSKISRETYYFSGSNDQNYVKYDSNRYRILSVEKDDSLVLYCDSDCSSNFNGLTQLQTCYKTGTSGTTAFCYVDNEKPVFSKEISKESTTGICNFSSYDIASTMECNYNYGYEKGETVNFGWAVMTIKWSFTSPFSFSRYTITDNKIELKQPGEAYKIHLKSCMKITGGIGDLANPYILENKC